MQHSCENLLHMKFAFKSTHYLLGSSEIVYDSSNGIMPDFEMMTGTVGLSSVKVLVCSILKTTSKPSTTCKFFLRIKISTIEILLILWLILFRTPCAVHPTKGSLEWLWKIGNHLCLDPHVPYSQNLVRCDQYRNFRCRSICHKCWPSPFHLYSQYPHLITNYY